MTKGEAYKGVSDALHEYVETIKREGAPLSEVSNDCESIRDILEFDNGRCEDCDGEGVTVHEGKCETCHGSGKAPWVHDD